MMFGAAGVDTLVGGDGDDILNGGTGNDQMFGGDASDIHIWNPGDGSDLIEGGAGRDILQFMGGAGDDTMALSADGSRLRFDRQPGNIVMDVAETEQVDANYTATFVGLMSAHSKSRRWQRPPTAPCCSSTTALPIRLMSKCPSWALPWRTSRPSTCTFAPPGVIRPIRR